MGTSPTKATDNVYCQYRIKAATYNHKLKSREGASEAIGVSSSTLTDYELGNIKVVPPDKVQIMIKVYNAPELRSWYCSTQCPLGMENVRQIIVKEGTHAAIGVAGSLGKAGSIMKKLLKIFADGKLEANEIPKLKKILSKVSEIVSHGQELLLWAEKNLKDVQEAFREEEKAERDSCVHKKKFKKT